MKPSDLSDRDYAEIHRTVSSAKLWFCLSTLLLVLLLVLVIAYAQNVKAQTEASIAKNERRIEAHDTALVEIVKLQAAQKAVDESRKEQLDRIEKQLSILTRRLPMNGS